MNKKLLAGLASVVSVAAVFWACGDGSINKMDIDDETMSFQYAEGSEDLKGLKETSIAACATIESGCYDLYEAYQNGETEIPASSAATEPDGPDANSSAEGTPLSSAGTMDLSSSSAIVISTNSNGGSSASAEGSSASVGGSSASVGGSSASVGGSSASVGSSSSAESSSSSVAASANSHASGSTVNVVGKQYDAYGKGTYTLVMDGSTGVWRCKVGDNETTPEDRVFGKFNNEEMSLKAWNAGSNTIDLNQISSTEITFEVTADISGLTCSRDYF